MEALQECGECFASLDPASVVTLVSRSKEIMDNEEFWIELSDCGEWGTYAYLCMDI